MLFPERKIGFEYNRFLDRVLKEQFLIILPFFFFKPMALEHNLLILIQHN